MYIVNRLATD